MRILWLLPALAGCATTNPPAAPAPGPPAEGRAELEALEAPFRDPANMVARLNETVRVGGVAVTPLAVLEDSRCPRDVACVWEGRIRLRARVAGVGEPVLELRQPARLPDGRMLHLVAAFPPRWTRPPAGVDLGQPMRFAFRVEGR